MKTSSLTKWLIRTSALLAPMYTVFYQGIYEHPDAAEQKLLYTCLLMGFSGYLIAGIIFILLT